MRLLDVETKELRYFVKSTDVAYAILSHCWGDDEVMYQDIVDKTASQKGGYGKLEMFCNVAAREGFRYAWVDTCCIDKSSSSELSEAINSMFSWYQQADACYAYLFDCKYKDVAGLTDPRRKSEGIGALRASKWFTRGFTLQELIAPTTVVFLSAEWKEFGTKRELCMQIRDITNIHEDVLVDPAQIDKYCVAQRLSWAATRVTTRPEDQAYGLMGLLDVNMPLLYGEGGENAFIRLQLEILKKFNDQSILAWRREADEMLGANINTSGVLASSVSNFGWCHGIKHRPRDMFRSTQGARAGFPQEVAGPFVKINGMSVKYDLKEHESLRALAAQKQKPDSTIISQDNIPRHQRSLSSRASETSTPAWLSHIYSQFKGPSATNQWLSNLYIMLLEECSSSEDEMIGILLRVDQNTSSRAHYPSIVTLPKQQDLKANSRLQDRIFHVLSYPPKTGTTLLNTTKEIHLLTQPATYERWRSQPQMCHPSSTCFAWPHWCWQKLDRLSLLPKDPPSLRLWDWIEDVTGRPIDMSLAFRPWRNVLPPLPSILLRFSSNDGQSLLVNFVKGNDQDLINAYNDKNPEYESLSLGVRRFHHVDGIWLVVKMREGPNDLFLHVNVEDIPKG